MFCEYLHNERSYPYEILFIKVVKNYQMIFRKDPCKDARTRGVNVRAHVLSRRNARAHVYAFVRVRVCTDLYEKSLEFS